TVRETAAGLEVIPKGQVTNTRKEEPSFGEAVTELQAATKQLAASTAKLVTQCPDEEVVGAFMLPRTLDGKGGEVVEMIATGAEEERQFAEPTPYYGVNRLDPDKLTQIISTPLTKLKAQ